jgi:hypothetical protein
VTQLLLLISLWLRLPSPLWLHPLSPLECSQRYDNVKLKVPNSFRAVLGSGAVAVLLCRRVQHAVQRHRVHTQAAATETVTQELSFATGGH